MFSIGDKFRVHFDYMNKGEYQYGVVSKIKLIDGTVYYYDDTQLIWTCNDADFYEVSKDVFIVWVAYDYAGREIFSVCDNEDLAKYQLTLISPDVGYSRGYFKTKVNKILEGAEWMKH